MTQLPYAIELHDSDLVGIEVVGSKITLQLRPAYVHQEGKGWVQGADIEFFEASLKGVDLSLPVEISDGTLRTSKSLYENLLTLPFVDLGPAELSLVLKRGEELRVSGTSIKILLLGSPIFIENVE